MFDTDKGQTLLHLARAAIAKELGFISNDFPRTDWLEQPGATFVTLTLNGQLRGCIGSLEAHRPLIDDVRHNAVASAFSDPRFDPLSKAEFADVLVDVSLLSTPQAIQFSSEQDALAQLHPGKDGVILEYCPSDTLLAKPADCGRREQATIPAPEGYAPPSHGRRHRATYLPQVWAQLPDPQTFINHLKNKAGLPENFWSSDIRLSRYSVQKWHEGEQHG